jgi:broad specificity phosphatase PhoE
LDGMLRLLLIRHGATAAVRGAAFADGEPLEAAARERAGELAGNLPARAVAVSGPEPACRETAAALGVNAALVTALAGCDVGSWRGRTLDRLQADDPAGLIAWMSEPDAAPHGGESLTAFARRVSEWMRDAAAGDGFLVAIVDAGVVKAAVCHALDVPVSAFWRVDVAPLNVSELRARDGRWTVRHLNAPLARGDGVGYGAY